MAQAGAHKEHLGRLSLSERGTLVSLCLQLDGETFAFRQGGRIDGMTLDGRFSITHGECSIR